MASNLRQIPLVCSGHTRPVVQLDFSDINDNAYFLISACKDGRPMLRHGNTGDWIGTFDGHKGAVWGVTLNKNGTLAATGAVDFTAKIWNAITGNEIYSFQHKHVVKSVAFDIDSKYIVTGSNEKLLRVFNLEQCQAKPDIYEGHDGAIKQALFIHNNKCIISAAVDKTIRVWDCLSGKEVQRLIFNDNPNSLEISADNHILTVTHGSSISFWAVDTLTKLKEIVMPTNISSASLHPNKHTFVCGGDDFKMYKLDYITGNEIESFKGHFGSIHSVKFSPDGELYASGSEDGTVRLWQTTVGKTYGLWKYTQPGDLNDSFNSSRQIHVN